MAKVTLVGAGPGDPELISMKGVRALAKADVVLYDALVHVDILNYAPQSAVRVFVGKRKGQHSLPQEKINQLIVTHALQYGNVVRLKGGDPFVFGRGQEEVAYIKNFDLEVEVIPGISSCISVPSSQGIPVTSRGYSESFWVITGTTKSHMLSDDVKLAVQSSATVIILMGMSKLKEIASLYLLADKGEMPVAIIQEGTRETERYVVSTMNEIEGEAKLKSLTSPAIIVIGEVVNLHPESVLNRLEVLKNG